MSLIVMALPESSDEQAAWLERTLVGPDLGRLVSELRAIHGPAAEQEATLAELLGPQMAAVAADGLGGLSDRQVRGLLTRPDLLLELQEYVLVEGGLYWDRLLHADGDLQRLVGRGRKDLEAALAPRRLTPAPMPEAPIFLPRRRSIGGVQMMLAGLAIAAAVLVCVYPWNDAHRAVAAWGWERPGALPQDVSREEYLRALAAAGQQWFAKRPEDAAGLSERIGDLRRGCDTLLASEHGPLTESDRRWLDERCRKWAAKFADAQAQLEAGQGADEVRASVDGTVKQLVAAIRDRSRQPG